MARDFFANPSKPSASFQRFKAAHPRVEDYARFRAVGEKRRESWWTWPERLRNGAIETGDYDETARRYHLYVQWLADAQVSALAERAGKRGPGLYLDLPLGVNPDGYDVSRERDSFAVGASAGAPPDSFFTLGQEWGFPPLHPENLRASGYRYLRDVLKNHFQYAGVLRIDHLMGLHRSYWVPQNFGATKGVYVRYPSDELYAVFCLESNRSKCALVGEDLGTVPPEVRPAMAHHNIHRLYLGQFEMKPDWNDPFTWVQGGSVASLNSHDLPTFGAFWNDVDIADRQSQGLIGEEEAAARARPSPSSARNCVGEVAARGANRPRRRSEMGLAGVSNAHGAIRRTVVCDDQSGRFMVVHRAAEPARHDLDPATELADESDAFFGGAG